MPPRNRKTKPQHSSIPRETSSTVEPREPISSDTPVKITSDPCDLTDPSDKADLTGLTTTKPLYVQLMVLSALVFVTIMIKCHRLDLPNQVVFDEVHFGGYAMNYLKGKFFFDVHPPLGKLAFAAVLNAMGYQGEFSFEKIGLPYDDQVPYLQMRWVSAAFGAMLVPLAFVTLQSLGFSLSSSLFAACLVLFDSATTLQYRLILLDSFLVCFMAATICFWVRFQAKKDEPFTLPWFVDLLLTGVFLGCTLSVKAIGLFATVWIGGRTILDLYGLLCDSEIDFCEVFGHFLARAFCLILVPVAIYIAVFYVHFEILTETGPGDGMMSMDFQKGLLGNTHAIQNAKEVGIGSQIMLRHMSSKIFNLRSHIQTYPEGSRHQQVTGCALSDKDSRWIVHPPASLVDSEPYSALEDDSKVRLMHVVTGCYLRVTGHPAPITPSRMEVACLGQYGQLDDLNQWRVALTRQGDPGDKEISLKISYFQLINVKFNCALSLQSEVSLPEWGFGQQEITCDPLYEDPANSRNTVWVIEENLNGRASSPSPAMPLGSLSFLGKLIEMHKTMWTANEGFTASHPYQSPPENWPFAERGVNYWVHEKNAVYFIGNPVVWWTSASCVGIFAVLYFLLAARAKRGYQDRESDHVRTFERFGQMIAVGWALHYAPFFLMKRQLFLHHYMPALYYSMLLAGFVFEFLLGRAPRIIRVSALVAAMAVMVWSHLEFL